jgi:hypothetical protein
MQSETEVRANRLSMTELEKFDQKICETQKKYDELTAESKLKELKLRKHYEELEYLKREYELMNSNSKDSSQAKVSVD